MKFIVIGLGSFGAAMARTLYTLDNEVIAVDSDRDKVDEIKDCVTEAVLTDSTERPNLEALRVQDMDAAVVGLGPAMEASILTVLHLHELGARRIVAKALTEDHAKILGAVGATDVIYPERDTAERMAHRLCFPNLIDYLPLLPGVAIEQVAPPDAMAGRSLRELDLINRFGVQVVAVRKDGTAEFVYIPKGDYVVRAADRLIVVGPEDKLKKLDSA